MEGGTGALFALRDALEEVLLGVQREGSAGEAVGRAGHSSLSGVSRLGF